jgi:hypothetical protein
LDAEKQARLDALAGRVSYRQVDLNDLDQVTRLIHAIDSRISGSTAFFTAPE